jgi:glycosyltransferase involved in cell wall biosynthesis
VIHVVPAIAEEASGPSYSVVRLCQSLIDAGENVKIAALDWAPLRSTPDFVNVFPMGMGPKRLGRSPSMYRWLREETEAGRADIIHSHGMWQMNAVYPGRLALGGKTKLVASPRGAFSSWAMRHGSPLKRVFWPLLQRPALSQASCFHATASEEHQDIRRLGFHQPVAVIPIGIDVPAFVQATPGPLRTLLFLGRIHPSKGVDILLHAWSRVMRRFPGWQVLVAGTDVVYGAKGDYLQRMKDIATGLGLERLKFVGPLYGEDKLYAYREAELFVLPTHSENFGITVAEAQAAGTPVIVTKGAPWKGVQTQSSGWWIDVGVEPLVDCLEKALALPREELAERGNRGREWMLREYSWKTVAQKMRQTYHWLIKGGAPPDCIHSQ